MDLRKDPMALQRLKDAAEKAKIELSFLLRQKLTFLTSLQ
nr:Hsp70 family protein [Okeania hirsuta]